MTGGQVALSGARGFLGWHTRAALQETSTPSRSFAVGADFDAGPATAALDGASRFVHIAGVNRGTDEEVASGNVLFARQAAEALQAAGSPPPVVVFANSTQAGSGGLYGDAKAEASGVLEAAARAIGAEFVDVVLPNLFGEEGRPFYNAVTSTFCHLLARGETPTVVEDRELTLMHAQDAADLLLGTRDVAAQTAVEHSLTVSGLLAALVSIDRTYRLGEIPDIADALSRNLFNTYRSYLFPEHAPIPLVRHADARGSFFETLRSHGGTGQASFSTTAPGISRGDHFHRRKVERFVVLSGEATMELRKLFTSEVISFSVTGDAPVAVDMPTMWAHNITNTGGELLYTSFWTNDIFDPNAPDTIPEAVR